MPETLSKNWSLIQFPDTNVSSRRILSVRIFQGARVESLIAHIHVVYFQANLRRYIPVNVDKYFITTFRSQILSF